MIFPDWSGVVLTLHLQLGFVQMARNGWPNVLYDSESASSSSLSRFQNMSFWVREAKLSLTPVNQGATGTSSWPSSETSGARSGASDPVPAGTIGPDTPSSEDPPVETPESKGSAPALGISLAGSGEPPNILSGFDFDFKTGLGTPSV